MVRRDQTEIRARIVIERAVPDVLHSLQSKDGTPVDPKRSLDGKPLIFDFPLRVAPGPKYYGDQVRSEGPDRRFVYICIGKMAGDRGSSWSRRMKIDLHDTDRQLIDQAIAGEGILELRLTGTAPDGTPACATIRPVTKRVTPR